MCRGRSLRVRFGAACRTPPSYRCTDANATLVPIAEILDRDCMLNTDALRRLLCGVRDGADFRQWRSFESLERSRQRYWMGYTGTDCRSRWGSHRFRRFS